MEWEAQAQAAATAMRRSYIGIRHPDWERAWWITESECYVWIDREGGLQVSGFDFEEELLAAHLTGELSPALVSLLCLRELIEQAPAERRRQELKKRVFPRVPDQTENPLWVAYHLPELKEDDLTQLYRSGQLPEALEAAITRHPEPRVRASVIWHGLRLRPSTYQRLAADEAAICRESVAEDVHATPELLIQLASDPVPEVVYAVARRQVPEEAQDRIERHPDPVARVLFAHVVKDVGRQLRLAEDKVPAVRGGLAENGSLKEEAMLKMAEDADLSVRMALAGREGLPKAVVVKLAADENARLRLRLVPYCQRWPELFGHFRSDPDPHVLSALARQDGFQHAHRDLARHPNPLVRAAVATASEDSELVAELAADGAAGVRIAAAAHAWLPEQVAVRLSQDASPEVRLALAGSSESEVALQLLLERKEQPLMSALAGRKQLPAPIALELAEEKDPSLRQRMAQHSENTEALKLLAEDQMLWETLIDRQDCPVAVLALIAEKLRDRYEPSLRKKVIKHPKLHWSERDRLKREYGMERSGYGYGY